MKSFTAVIAAIAICASLAFAQTSPLARAGGRKSDARMKGRSMDERVAAFAKAMNLKSEQKAKVKAILIKQTEKQKAVAADKKLSTDARRKKIYALLQETNSFIRKTLDKTQQKRFDALLKQSDARRKNMGAATRPPRKP